MHGILNLIEPKFFDNGMSAARAARLAPGGEGLEEGKTADTRWRTVEDVADHYRSLYLKKELTIRKRMDAMDSGTDIHHRRIK